MKWQIVIEINERGQASFVYPQDRPVSTIAVMEAVLDAIKAQAAKKETLDAQGKVEQASPTDLSQFLNVNSKGR